MKERGDSGEFGGKGLVKGVVGGTGRPKERVVVNADGLSGVYHK